MSIVTHLPEQNTFILSKDSEEAGHLKYDVSDGLWNITHTVISPAYRGQGLARILVEEAMAEAAKHNIRLTASCDYAASVLATQHR